MAGHAFQDRTRGGRPTPCFMNADLDKLTIEDDLTILYKGKRPTSLKSIGRGGYGEIFRLVYADGAKFILKKQQTDDEALDNLDTAEGLRDCDLVEFKSVNVDDQQICVYPAALDPVSAF